MSNFVHAEVILVYKVGEHPRQIYTFTGNIGLCRKHFVLYRLAKQEILFIISEVMKKKSMIDIRVSLLQRFTVLCGYKVTYHSTIGELCGTAIISTAESFNIFQLNIHKINLPRYLVSLLHPYTAQRCIFVF